MRIAFVDIICDPAKPCTTGLSDVVWDMARRLAHLGEEVHVVAPYTVDVVPHDGVRVHRFALPPIAYRNIVGQLWIAWAAYRCLRSLGKFDVVHVPEYLSGAVLGTFLADTPVVVTEPGNIFERVAWGNPYDPVTTLVYKVAARRTAATCTRLVATSAEMVHWWRRTRVSEGRIYLLPLGVDTRLFSRQPGAKAALGLPGELPVVLFAARLSRENGLDIALRAIARLQEFIGPVQFHVLGDGPEREASQGLSSSLGIQDQVTWHGWVDLQALPMLYSAADAFVSSSLSGGTPRVLLQAMACGAPVIASARGGVVDHVVHGKNGILFSPGSSDALADALALLLTQPELGRRLGSEAERYVAISLDWDVLVQKLRRDVYDVIAAKESTGSESSRQAGEDIV